MKSFCLIIFLMAAFYSCQQEQRTENDDPVRRKSPIAIAAVTHQPSNTYAKVVYGQPYKNGRAIFGSLEPFGQVWRTGANEATELTITKPIRFNNDSLAAGTYALFTIPDPQKWTVILNDSLGQWGAFDYNKTYDHLRTTVPTQRTEQVVEAFTIEFSAISDDSTSLYLRWDTTEVAVPIRFLGD